MDKLFFIQLSRDQASAMSSQSTAIAGARAGASAC